MKKMKPWLPLILTAALGAWFFGTSARRPTRDFAFNEFGALPVVFNGRVEADGFARAQFAPGNPREADAQYRAVEGLERKPENHLRQRMARNVMMNPAVADAWPVFRVDNPDLITLLKLPEKTPRSKRTASIIHGTRSRRRSI
jgi:hypothetical protein